jgi:uncharacterized membrane protein YhhN
MGLEHSQILRVAPIVNEIQWPETPSPQILLGAVTLLIASEARSFYAGSALFKTMASFAFVGAGVRATLAHGIDVLDWTSWTEHANQASLFLVAGLVFSLCGDILLIPSREAYHAAAPSKEEGQSARFKTGTFFFVLAHIAYTCSFFAGAPHVKWPEFGASLFFGAVTFNFIGIIDKDPRPDALFVVPEDMRGLVAAYVAIIWTMVATATATDSGFQKILGGCMFMISDLFVASDIFGPKQTSITGYRKPGQARQGWKARGIGWIVYFGAQLVLAGSI